MRTIVVLAIGPVHVPGVAMIMLVAAIRPVDMAVHAFVMIVIDSPKFNGVRPVNK